MKRNYYWTVLVAVVIGLGLYVSAPVATATHDAALICADCHIMHGGAHGQTAGQQGLKLLKDGGTGTDFRVVSNNNCLSCHDGTVAAAEDVTHATTYALGGGTFGSLTAGAGGSNNGHDIMGGGLGVTAVANAPIADGANTDYAEDDTDDGFRCATCHDPHYAYTDNARLLRDGTDMPEPGGTGIGAVAVPTVAWLGISPVGTGTPYATTDHNGYRSGMSEWCANCHTGLANSTDNHHPAGNTVATANITTAGYETNYGTDWFPTVPTEFATAATDDGANDGPETVADQDVFCLSCHNAHGSANAYAGRWNLTGGQSSTWDGSAGTCNACHGK